MLVIIISVPGDGGRVTQIMALSVLDDVIDDDDRSHCVHYDVTVA